MGGGSLDIIIEGKTILEHLIDGSDFEDNRSGAYWRAKNHFHNPTRFTFEAGLSEAYGLFKGHSALEWAETVPENEWGYETFKDAYLLAMTAPTPEQRQLSLQKAFRTVGHLLHLVQDMAVPAHTRNDLVPAHLTKLRRGVLPVSNPLEYYLEKHPELIEAAVVDEVPQLPELHDYLDTGIYLNGFHPNSGVGVGLAEYTNSTFFSASTFFAENRIEGSRDWFPHPARTETERRDESRDILVDFPHLADRATELSGNGYALHYEALVSDDPERSVDHLTAHGFWVRFLQTLPVPLFVPLWDYALDDACKQDYLEKLVPKAIAYSAGLLAHIFRGDIDFAYDPNTAQLRISNLSASDMLGVFKLYYDRNDGTRAPLEGAEWTLSLPVSSSVTVDGLVMPRDASVESVLVLVFDGRQGSEARSVTGKESRLATHRFSYRTEYEHFTLEYPSETDTMGNPDPETGLRSRCYQSKMQNVHGVGAALISRDTSFFLQMLTTPDTCADLGFGCAQGSWLTLATSTYLYPGLVDYFKVEVAEDQWVWVYDSSGTRECVGWGDVATPLIYDEGLWRPSTGYVDDFRSHSGGNNLSSECTLPIFQGASGFHLHLAYELDPGSQSYQPRCSNAESMIATAKSFLPEYVDFYYQALERSLPYRSSLLDDAWLQYGFEVRVNQVISAYYGKGNQRPILDSPVTFRKRFGRDELTVY